MRLLAAFLCAAIGLGASLVSLYYFGSRRSHPSAIGQVASNASPDVAVLLREAEAIALAALDEFPTDPHAYDVMGCLHSRYGRSDEAVHYWQQCVTLDPSFDQAHFAMGVAAEERGDHAQAAIHFRRALELNPASPVFPVYFAKSLRESGQVPAAIGVLEEAVRKRPNAVPALVLLGEMYLQQHDYQRVRQHLSRAVELAPDLASPHYGLGTACARLGDLELSKKYLARFQVLKARDEQAHRDSLKDKNNVASVRSHVAEVYAEVAKIYLSRGDFQKGEELLLRGSKLDPNQPALHQTLAWLYEEQGDLASALMVLSDVVDRVPNDLSLQLKLGELLVRMHRYEAAESAFQKAIELTPHEAGGYVALASLYLRIDRDFAKAQQLAEKAVHLEPLPESFALLTTICQRTGDFASAQAVLDEALRSDPGSVELQRMRSALESLETPKKH